MGRPARPPIRHARKLILQRARAYKYSGKYVRVQVFSKDVIDVEKLLTAFGGRKYRHHLGFLWLLAKKADVIDLYEEFKDDFPSVNAFEKVIEDVYIKTGPP